MKSLAISQVDIAVWGHVHNYERSCAVFNGTCLGMPTNDSAGIATYNNADYKAPVQIVVGTAGFESNDFGTATVSNGLLQITQSSYVQLISSSSTKLQYLVADKCLIDIYQPPAWSLARIKDYGYIYIQADRTRLTVQVLIRNLVYT